MAENEDVKMEEMVEEVQMVDTIKTEQHEIPTIQSGMVTIINYEYAFSMQLRISSKSTKSTSTKQFVSTLV